MLIRFPDSSLKHRRAPFFPALLAIAMVSTVGHASSKIELPDWGEEGKAPEGFQLGVGLWPSGALDVAASAEKAKAEKKEEDKKSGKSEETDAPGAAEGEPEVKLANTGGGEAEKKEGTPQEVAENTDKPADEPKAVRRPVVEIPPDQLKPGVPSRIFPEETLPPLVEEMEVMPPIEGPLRDQFFKRRPHEFLIDPQQLLTEQKSNDVRRFLEYHAEEAGIDIYMIIMGKGQSVPEDISLREKHSEWFGEIPTALVATTIGSLGKTEIIYGHEIKKTVNDNALEKVYQHCLREANKIENPSDQIEQMALELSIQLYWVSQIIEKGHDHPSVAESSPQNVVEAVATTARPGTSTAQPIPFQQVKEDAAFIPEKLFGVPFWWVIAGVIGVFSIIALWIITHILNRDNLDKKPVLFEELSIPDRLGGEYSGGGFVGISYDVTGQS